MSFFTTIFRGSSAVLCAIAIPLADLRSLSSYYYAHITKQFTSRSPTDKNTKHTQMTYTCGHILRNNTNSMNADQREE